MGLVKPYILWGNGILERMEDIAGTCQVMVRRWFIVYRCTHVMCFIDGRMISWSVLLLEEWLSIYEERRVWLRETRFQSALLCTNFSVLVVLVMRHRRFQASKFLGWCHVCTSDSWISTPHNTSDFMTGLDMLCLPFIPLSWSSLSPVPRRKHI